ncbi:MULTISPECIES: hypothetical protein [unclassified Anaerobiospirillum]|uniref:hypothetical protein n=1 Tax=unclassified Anaerobiospirillum TaxID=2647410 RepID=UPI001FF6D017|nr:MULTISPECIES: hypothetical protein [unclassified Anaerobiospirillum]MCK0535158.1 hypothetical protein [Anaerobiospirillum sp. NML120511]MCK0539408.1 hypothetical protein [Anaerobiospirillum sp. NML02-A-032]
MLASELGGLMPGSARNASAAAIAALHQEAAAINAQGTASPAAAAAAGAAAGVAGAAAPAPSIRPLGQGDTRMLLQAITKGPQECERCIDSLSAQLGFNVQQREEIIRLAQTLSASQAVVASARASLSQEQRNNSNQKRNLEQLQHSLGIDPDKNSSQPRKDIGSNIGYYHEGQGAEGSLGEGHTLPTPAQRAALIASNARLAMEQAAAAASAGATASSAGAAAGDAADDSEALASLDHGADDYDDHDGQDGTGQPGGKAMAGSFDGRKKIDTTSRFDYSDQARDLETIHKGGVGFNTRYLELNAHAEDPVRVQQEMEERRHYTEMAARVLDYFVVLDSSHERSNQTAIKNSRVKDTNAELLNLSNVISGFNTINENRANGLPPGTGLPQSTPAAQGASGSDLSISPAAAAAGTAAATAAADSSADDADDFVFDQVDHHGYQVGSEHHLGAQFAGSVSLENNDASNLGSIEELPSGPAPAADATEDQDQAAAAGQAQPAEAVQDAQAAGQSIADAQVHSSESASAAEAAAEAQAEVGSEATQADAGADAALAEGDGAAADASADAASTAADSVAPAAAGGEDAGSSKEDARSDAEEQPHGDEVVTAAADSGAASGATLEIAAGFTPVSLSSGSEDNQAAAAAAPEVKAKRTVARTDNARKALEGIASNLADDEGFDELDSSVDDIMGTSFSDLSISEPPAAQLGEITPVSSAPEITPNAEGAALHGTASDADDGGALSAAAKSDKQAALQAVTDVAAAAAASAGVQGAAATVPDSDLPPWHMGDSDSRTLLKDQNAWQKSAAIAAAAKEGKSTRPSADLSGGSALSAEVMAEVKPVSLSLAAAAAEAADEDDDLMPAPAVSAAAPAPGAQDAAAAAAAVTPAADAMADAAGDLTDGAGGHDHAEGGSSGFDTAAAQQSGASMDIAAQAQDKSIVNPESGVLRADGKADVSAEDARAQQSAALLSSLAARASHTHNKEEQQALAQSMGKAALDTLGFLEAKIAKNIELTGANTGPSPWELMGRSQVIAIDDTEIKVHRPKLEKLTRMSDNNFLMAGGEKSEESAESCIFKGTLVNAWGKTLPDEGTTALMAVMMAKIQEAKARKEQSDQAFKDFAARIASTGRSIEATSDPELMPLSLLRLMSGTSAALNEIYQRRCAAEQPAAPVPAAAQPVVGQMPQAAPAGMPPQGAPAARPAQAMGQAQTMGQPPAQARAMGQPAGMSPVGRPSGQPPVGMPPAGHPAAMPPAGMPQGGQQGGPGRGPGGRVMEPPADYVSHFEDRYEDEGYAPPPDVMMDYGSFDDGEGYDGYMSQGSNLAADMALNQDPEFVQAVPVEGTDTVISTAVGMAGSGELPGWRRSVDDDYLDVIGRDDEWYALIVKAYPQHGLEYSTLVRSARRIDSSDPSLWHMVISRNDEFSTLGEAILPKIEQRLSEVHGSPIRLDVVTEDNVPRDAPAVKSYYAHQEDIARARQSCYKIRGLGALLRDLGEDLANTGIELYQKVQPAPAQAQAALEGAARP